MKTSILAIAQLIDRIDRNLSNMIHEAVVKPKFLECIVFPFGLLCSTLFMPIVVIFLGYVYPIYIRDKSLIT